MSELTDSRFLKACRREPVDCTPIWMMRQAGRYMPEYRAIRQQNTMLEVINSARLSAEVTLQPVNAFEFDAAIIFSDILPPLMGMGLGLDFVKGEGPQILNPVGTPADVEKLQVCDASGIMGPTLEAISMVRKELEPRGIPVIGFCGAPFTLACYAIQGSGSKMYERARAFMYNHPNSWDELMNKLVDVLIDYLECQVRSGASALQVFDSWAGVLSPADYRRFVAPYNRRLLLKGMENGVPVINFSTGTGTWLADVARCGGSVVGVDWRMPLGAARKLIGEHQAIQGNLDPVALLAPWEELQSQVDAVLLEAGDGPGHVFNLGHGILPPTPMESVRRVVDYVHERTS